MGWSPRLKKPRQFTIRYLQFANTRSKLLDVYGATSSSAGSITGSPDLSRMWLFATRIADRPTSPLLAYFAGRRQHRWRRRFAPNNSTLAIEFRFSTSIRLAVATSHGPSKINAGMRGAHC